MKVKVIAKKGVKVPKEGNPRKYITDARAVPVEKSAYYRKRIGEGSLIEVPEPKKPEPKKTKK